MATSGGAYRQILRDLEKGTYKPIYYLMGDEPFFIDSISDYIREHALPEEARDFNQMVIYGNETTMNEVKNVFWYVLNFVAYYVLLAGVYFVPAGHPIVKFNDNCMWGIDQFLLGAIVGTVVFFGMQKWYQKIKANNGGHAKYPFQKVVMPFTGLLIATLVLWAIIRWLPMIGIALG